jgi:phosphatidylglycerophosphatase A
LLLVPVIHGLPIWYVQAAVLALLALVAVPIASWGERHFQTKDPSPVVIDEIISIPITAAFAPLSVAYLAIGFVLNRAADIVKPPPARQLQALPRGWGIVIDDVLSGLYAGLLLLLTHRFAGGWLASNLPSWLTTPLPAAMH